MGDGTYTYFWSDRWLGEDALGVRFRRLFELSVNKWVLVSHMARLGWGGGGGGRWSLALEEEFGGMGGRTFSRVLVVVS